MPGFSNKFIRQICHHYNVGFPNVFLSAQDLFKVHKLKVKYTILGTYSIY